MYIEEVSLDDLIGLEDAENGLIQDGVYSNDQVMEEYVKEKIESALDKLTSKEREIVALYWGVEGHDPKTLKEIGDIYGVSSERIRQILRHAMHKMHPRPKRRKRLVDYLDDYPKN